MQPDQTHDQPEKSSDSADTRHVSADALTSLLADEDRLVSAMAMDELLQHEGDLERILATEQESDDPNMRRRIHQMSSILAGRRRRQRFIEGVRHSRLDLWDGIVQINHQYNTRMNTQTVERLIDELAKGVKRPATGNRIAAFMRGEGFSTAREDVLGADLYLVEDILAQRVGSPILLAAAAQEVGRRIGWIATIVLYKGKHCLIDTQNNFIEPAEGWRVSKFTPDVKLHPCADKDVWLTILCQLYLAAVLEGRVHAIHRVGSLLAELSDGSFRDLPYPLGS